MGNISRIRKVAASANRHSRSRRKELEAQKKKKIEEMRAAGNRKLAAKLKKQRQGRQSEQDKLDSEQARIRKQRMLLGSDKAGMEQKHFQEQLSGAERAARERQQAAQAAAQKQRDVLAADDKARQKFARDQRNAEKDILRAKEEKVAQVRHVLLRSTAGTPCGCVTPRRSPACACAAQRRNACESTFVHILAPRRVST